MKLWKVKKNLTQEEWSVVLNKIDEIASPGREVRVVVSGTPFSKKRIREARKRYGNSARSKISAAVHSESAIQIHPSSSACAPALFQIST